MGAEATNLLNEVPTSFSRVEMLLPTRIAFNGNIGYIAGHLGADISMEPEGEDGRRKVTLTINNPDNPPPEDMRGILAIWSKQPDWEITFF